MKISAVFSCLCQCSRDWRTLLGSVLQQGRQPAGQGCDLEVVVGWEKKMFLVKQKSQMFALWGHTLHVDEAARQSPWPALPSPCFPPSLKPALGKVRQSCIWWNWICQCKSRLPCLRKLLEVFEHVGSTAVYRDRGMEWVTPSCGCVYGDHFLVFLSFFFLAALNM